VAAAENLSTWNRGTGFRFPVGA